MHTLRLTLLLAALALVLPAAEPPVTLPGTDGMHHSPLQVPADKKGVVLVFGSPFCNTSNTLLPELNALAQTFEDRFAFYLVHSEPSLQLTQVMEHQELLKVRPLALLDQQQLLAKRTGARVTPEAVVLDPSGKTLYQGRINDLYLGPTKRQRKATTADLRDALSAIATGQPVPTPRTVAVGCKIEGLP
jgi:thiol-disulfide isomerase/thioredoxin